MRLRTLALAAAVQIAAFAAPAFANTASESYVQQNATRALGALATGSSPDERSAKFGVLMDKFADVPGLADFVLGAYARPLRANPSLRSQWVTAYRGYAMAAYEDHFDKLRGATLKVTGSRDYQQNGKSCSRVASEMPRKEGGGAMAINWYLCGAGEAWKVVDVGIDNGGGEMKLAITQRDQMVAFLGGNGGDVNKLIARVKARTAALKNG